VAIEELAPGEGQILRVESMMSHGLTVEIYTRFLRPEKEEVRDGLRGKADDCPARSAGV